MGQYIVTFVHGGVHYFRTIPIPLVTPSSNEFAKEVQEIYKHNSYLTFNKPVRLDVYPYKTEGYFHLLYRNDDGVIMTTGRDLKLLNEKSKPEQTQPQKKTATKITQPRVVIADADMSAFSGYNTHDRGKIVPAKGVVSGRLM